MTVEEEEMVWSMTRRMMGNEIRDGNGDEPKSTEENDGYEAMPYIDTS